MTFLTIEQLADQLRAEGETTEQLVQCIRRWKAANPDFPYYQGRPGGKMRFVFGEVVDWLRRQTVAAKPTELYALPNPRPVVGENPR